MPSQKKYPVTLAAEDREALERVGGMPGSSGVRCLGVRDDPTSALSCGAGPAGGVCGPIR